MLRNDLSEEGVSGAASTCLSGGQRGEEQESPVKIAVVLGKSGAYLSGDSKNPGPERAQPWGLTRMTPLPAASSFSYTAVHLDPMSQQAVYVGPGGEPIKAGKHGTNKATKKKEKTGGGDGKNPKPPDQVEVQDYDDD